MFGDMELRYEEVFAQMPRQEQGYASCSLGLQAGWRVEVGARVVNQEG